MANIFAHSINIYGEIGSPCLQPRSVLKKDERLPPRFMVTCVFMPPALKKLMGHIAFGACVGAWVGAWVGHTFCTCTYCNF